MGERTANSEAKQDLPQIMSGETGVTLDLGGFARRVELECVCCCFVV